MKLYKLTDNEDQTYGGTQWGKGVTHSAKGRGAALCTDGFIHAYTHPLLAVLGNPIHAGFIKRHLWEAEGEIVVTDGFKVGCKTLTTHKRIKLPKVTIRQRVRFGILCALEVYKEKSFEMWARSWLDSSDTTRAAARAASRAAENVLGAASRAARAAWAAASAAEAAEAAAEAEARAARAAWAAEAAARAAWAAASAAEAAARGARGGATGAARGAAKAALGAAGAAEIDLAKIAERAIATTEKGREKVVAPPGRGQKEG